MCPGPLESRTPQAGAPQAQAGDSLLSPSSLSLGRSERGIRAQGRGGLRSDLYSPKITEERERCPGPRESPAAAPPLPVRVIMSFSGPLTHQTKLCENGLTKIASTFEKRNLLSMLGKTSGRRKDQKTVLKNKNYKCKPLMENKGKKMWHRVGDSRGLEVF